MLCFRADINLVLLARLPDLSIALVFKGKDIWNMRRELEFFASVLSFFYLDFFKRSNKAWLATSKTCFDVNKVYAVGKIAIQCHFRFCSWCWWLVRRVSRDMNRLQQPPPNVAPSAAWPPRHATTGSCRSLKSCSPWWARAGWWWKLQRWHRNHQSACQWLIGGWFRLE